MTPSSDPPSVTGAPTASTRALSIQWLALLLAVVGPVAVVAAGLAGTDRLDGNAVFHLVATHEPWLIAASAIAAALAAAAGRDARPAPLPRHPMRISVALAVGVALVGWLGWHLVLRGHLLSGDEFAADWLARVLRSGHVEVPVPADLQGVAPALTSAYTAWFPATGVLRATYMPGHAAVRAVFLALGDAAWTNPVLNGLGVLAVARAALNLAPSRPQVAVAAAAFSAASAQVVVNGMTAFAMPGYFALHALWLALWTAPGRWPYLAAGVGAIAIGWHNVAMHPLWAGPILLGALRHKDRRLLLWTGALYLVMGSGWLAVSRHLSTGASSHGGASLFGWPGQRAAVSQAAYATLWVTWQAPLALGFAGLAVRRWRTLPPVLQDALASAVCTWAFFVAFREPQGNGWGYRYLHGHLPTLSLLAGWGIGATPWTIGMRRTLAAACILALAALLPLRAVQIRRYVEPFALAERHLAAQPKETALLIDPLDVWYGIDLSRNPPDLAPPLRLNLRRTGPAAVQALIDQGVPVRRIGREELLSLGLTPLDLGRVR